MPHSPAAFGGDLSQGGRGEETPRIPSSLFPAASLTRPVDKGADVKQPASASASITKDQHRARKIVASPAPGEAAQRAGEGGVRIALRQTTPPSPAPGEVK